MIRKSAPIKNPQPLLQWLHLLSKEWDGSSGDVQVDRTSAREYTLHQKNNFNPYMRVKIKERGDNLTVTTTIFPGKKYLAGAIVLFGVVAFSAWVNLSLPQLIVALTFYLLIAHFLYWGTSKKLRGLRGIIMYIAENDEFPPD